jgi:hypothetical protein
MLNHGSVESQACAAEAVALLLELANGTWECVSDTSDGPEEFMELLHTLSTQSNRRLAKRARKEQRATFRSLCAYVLNNEPAGERLKLRGNYVDIEGWCALRRLNALRNLLQEAFQVALAASPTVQDILEIHQVVREGADSDILRVCLRVYLVCKQLYLMFFDPGSTSGERIAH